MRTYGPAMTRVILGTAYPTGPPGVGVIHYGRMQWRFVRRSFTCRRARSYWRRRGSHRPDSSSRAWLEIRLLVAQATGPTTEFKASAAFPSPIGGGIFVDSERQKIKAP